MKLSQKLLSYLAPQLLESRNSPVNGKINVFLNQNRVIIKVRGAIQAGGIADRRFDLTLKYLCQKYSQFHPRTGLILGYGAGNFAGRLAHHWSDLKLTGLDLDAVIVTLGQTYFSPQFIHPPKILIADAFTWVEQSKLNYDLIYIDLYHGFNIPQRLISKSFLSAIKRLMVKNSVVILNYYHSPQYPNYYSKLIPNLRAVFNHVNPVEIFENQVYYLAI